MQYGGRGVTPVQLTMNQAWWNTDCCMQLISDEYPRYHLAGRKFLLIPGAFRYHVPRLVPTNHQS
jgi:hypothetical protein